MDKKKVIFLSIIVSIIGMLITTGTFAFFNWQSNNNKGLSFNVASNLKNYIEYDNGDSTFVGDFQTSSSFTDGIHSTISIKKKQEAASISMVATINMDINSIGPNMAKSSALKWVVTSGNSSSVGPILSQGNFIGSKNGDTLMLLPNIEVTTSVKEYTIWIWLDINEHPSDALSGETLDTAVWTQIEQLAGKEEIYEITKISANYQRISATVINNKNVITKYAIMATTDTPSSWTNIDTNLQNNIYNLEYDTSATGTYYVWFMDSVGIMTSSSISVTNIDTTAPSCTFGEFSVTPIKNNETSEIILTCTDTESTIENYNLTIDNLVTSSSVVTITNVRKEQITNGYKYTITVTGTENDGIATLTLPANIIRNSMHLGNTITTSAASITVRNIIDLSSASITLNPTSFTYDGTAKEPTITVIVDGDTLTRNTDYSASFANNINVGTATVYITGINDYEGSASATFTIIKGTCPAPTNVSISSTGVVTWTGASNALSYEISIDNTNYTVASSGVDYKSTITASTGNRTVYVRSVCDSTNYNTPSTSASTSVSVYSVTLTKGTGVATVTGASNYISGATVSIDATVNTGYTWSNWTSGSTQISTTKTYSATITSDWNYTANATLNTPATPTVSGTTTKIYGASNTTLTCNTTTIYVTGITKYYSFGYAETSGGSITNWTSFSTTSTITIGAEDYVGDRYYSCRMYVTDGTQTTSSVASSASLMRINNAAVTFNLNGGDSMISAAQTWYGYGENLYNPVYGRKGSSLIYEGIRDVNISSLYEDYGDDVCPNGLGTSDCDMLILIPWADKTGYTFTGWFTATSGGDLVTPMEDYDLEPSVPGWTDENSKFIRTTDGTLYAQWSLDVPSINLTGPTTKIYGASSTTITCNHSDISGVTTYYSFGYTTTSSASPQPTNWTSYSTSKTITIDAEEYVGDRYYWCRAYSTDGTLVSSVKTVRNSTPMRINNAALTFIMPDDANIENTDSCGILEFYNPSYIRKGTPYIYKGIRDDDPDDGSLDDPTCPAPLVTIYDVAPRGFYTAASGGEIVIDYDDWIIMPSVSGWTDEDSNFIRTTDGTLYAQWEHNTRTATFYYQSSTVAGTTTIASVTASCDDYGSGCAVTIPSQVKNSVGTWNNSYVGLASATYTMIQNVGSAATQVLLYSSRNFYAIYRTSVTNHYYTNGNYSIRTVYRNQYFTSTAGMSTTVLSTSASGTSNYSTAVGPGNAVWTGLATSATTTVGYSSIASAAVSTATILYTIYQFNVSYQKGANVSAIGSTTNSCKVTTSATACNVTLPSITPSSGYMSVGWNTSSGTTTGTSAGATYSLSSTGRTLYANAVPILYELQNSGGTTTGYVSTLYDAFTNVSDGGSIIALDNNTSLIAITNNKNVTLNTNGKTITLAQTITNSASKTLAIGGSGIITTSSTISLISSSGTLTLGSVTLSNTGTSANAIINIFGGVCNISGTKINNATGNGVLVSSASLNMSSGTVTGTIGIEINSSVASITGGRIYGTTSYGILIEGFTNGIASSVILGTNDSTFSSTIPLINSDNTYALRVNPFQNAGGNWYWYDGLLNGATSSTGTYSGNPTAIMSGYTIKTTARPAQMGGGYQSSLTPIS